MSSVPSTCYMLCLILKILCLTFKIILGYNHLAATSGLKKMRYLWYPWKHTLGTKLCVCFTYKKKSNKQTYFEQFDNVAHCCT